MLQPATYNIGIFDSGYGGLTVLKEIISVCPQYNYVYLGDNARAPYGTRSFETVYKNTLEAVKKLFELNCSLVILACNTASAKALRSIQQNDLPYMNPEKRVLGVIRPCTEHAHTFTKNGNLGIFATQGTVASQSYEIEIRKFFPTISVHSQACPMWVPLVENREADSRGADYFVQQEIRTLFAKNKNIDAVLLGCTHYPLLMPKILQFIPPGVRVINQGEIVADQLGKYLHRHPDIEQSLIQEGRRCFYTTDSCTNFNTIGSTFMNQEIESQKIDL
ncbi:MAG: glutamate racemase [Bacteroidales bacterium]